MENFNLGSHLTNKEVSDLVNNAVIDKLSRELGEFYSFLSEEEERDAINTHFESLKSEIVERLGDAILKKVSSSNQGKVLDFLISDEGATQIENIARQSIESLLNNINRRIKTTIARRELPEDAFLAEVLEVYPEYLIVSVDTGGKEPKKVIISLEWSRKTFSPNQPVWVVKKFFKQGAGTGQMQFENHPNFKIAELYPTQPDDIEPQQS